MQSIALDFEDHKSDQLMFEYIGFYSMVNFVLMLVMIWMHRQHTYAKCRYMIEQEMMSEDLKIMRNVVASVNIGMMIF